MASKDGWRSNPNMGPAVRRIRKELGISEVELARRLGCTQQFVSRMELGKVPMHPARVVQVAKALGVSIQRVYAEARKKPLVQPNGCTTENDPS